MNATLINSQLHLYRKNKTTQEILILTDTPKRHILFKSSLFLFYPYYQPTQVIFLIIEICWYATSKSIKFFVSNLKSTYLHWISFGWLIGYICFMIKDKKINNSFNYIILFLSLPPRCSDVPNILLEMKTILDACFKRHISLLYL